jgi:hypothetical protein
MTAGDFNSLVNWRLKLISLQQQTNELKVHITSKQRSAQSAIKDIFTETLRAF